MRAYNILTSEVTVTTANNVNYSPLIRVVATTASVMTIKSADGVTTVGTMTIVPGVETLIRKEPSETLTSGAGSLLCTPVGLFA